MLLAGTGKMARNVGAWLLRRGLSVAFAGRPAGLASLQDLLRRDARRLADDDLPLDLGRASFHDHAAAPPAGLLLECVAESLALKRELLRAVESRLPADAPLLTCSSSIAPSALHPRCAGTHFFYPVELAGFLEVVLPSTLSDAGRAATLAFVERCGLKPIVQDERNAFAVNRLFLPLQDRCLQLVQQGAPPQVVDAASRSPLLPTGQLALLDAVGLDTVASALEQYCREAPDAFPSLRRGIAALVALGKLGRKNGDGLLCGTALPWPEDASTSVCAVDLERLFGDTCRRFVAAGELSEADLRVALAGLFGTEWS